jgi:predicted DNA-binding antitoxin AbrB/MazE fold protein
MFCYNVSDEVKAPCFGRYNMSITVEATYENGTLKLANPLPLKEHAKVQITVHTGISRARLTHGLMGWTGSAELAEHFAQDPELDPQENS